MAELEATINAGGAKKGADEFNRAVGSMGKNVKQSSDDVKKADKQVKIFSSSLKTAAAGIAAYFSARAIFTGGKAIIKNFVEQEDAVAQLNAALKSTQGVSGKTSEELQKFATELQRATRFGDEAIIAAQSQLLTFTNIAGKQFDDTTRAVLDLSTRMNQDLRSSVVQLGKALNDPVANLGALSRSGIQFSDAQKTMIKDLVESNKLMDAQNLILKELNTQFGGSAEAAADTLGGRMKQSANAFSDALQEVGHVAYNLGLKAIFEGWTKSLNGATDAIKNFADGIAVTKINVEISAIRRNMEATLREFDESKQGAGVRRGSGRFAGEVVSRDFEGFDPNKFILEQTQRIRELEQRRLGAVGGVVEALNPGEGKKSTAQELTDLQKMMAIMNQPISSDDRGVIGFLKLVEEAEGDVEDKTNSLGNTFKDVFTVDVSQFAVQAARNIQSAFADFLFDPFEQGLSGMVSGFATAIRRMAAELLSQRILFSLFSAIGGGGGGNTAIPHIGGAAINIPGQAMGGAWMHGIQRYASGGVVSSPTLFPMSRGAGLMGEAGPEAIMPLRRLPNGKLGVESSGGSVNVQIVDQRTNAPAAQVEESTGVDGRRLIRVLIRDEVKSAMARGAMDRSLQENFGLQRKGVRM